MIVTATRWKAAAEFFLIAAGSFFLAHLSFLFTFQNFSVPILWPLSGFGLIAILLIGARRVYPGLFFGALTAQLFNMSPFEMPSILLAVLMAAGNTVEPLLGAYLFRRYGLQDANPLNSVSGVFHLLKIAITMSCVNAFTAAFSSAAFNAIPWDLYPVQLMAWWLSGTIGDLVVLQVYWSFFPVSSIKTSRLSLLEFWLFVASLLACNVYLFGQNIAPVGHRPFSFMLIPFVVWSAIRFKRLGVSVIMLITSGFAIWGTMKNYGPFGYMPQFQSFYLVLLFLAVVILTGMIICASLKERNRLIERLEKIQRRFEQVIESSPHTIIIIGPDGHIELANRMAETMFGYSRSELIGKSIGVILPDHLNALLQEMQRLSMAGSNKTGLDLQAVHKTGTEIPVEIGLNPIEIEGKMFVLASIIDIRQRKNAEQALREAQEVLSRDKEMLERIVDERSLQLVQTQKDLEMINRLADIGTLAATVAHELRNPLGVIEMASYNLKRKNKAFADDRHLLNIEKKVQESNRIINNLLNYSRIKQPKFETVKICAVLDECIQSVKERIDVHTDIRIHKSYPADTDLMIEADPYQVREIFYNILANAQQSLEKNAGDIHVEVETAEEMVTITVADTGVGIEPGDLHRIFEPFFTRKSKGTGLGLAICNELVTFHKGKIRIDSEPRVGTTVKVTLPRSRSHYARENPSHR